MPEEGQKFKEVDASWKFIMSRVNANNAVTDVMRNKKLLDDLKQNHDSLEVVTKGLNNYLDTKRAAFPRFYFLSSEELLSILSETKDPTRVQPHLKKCFEGINKLEFDELKKIHGMYSGEGEYVPFPTVIDAMAARGAVEQWLIQVEDMMIASVREVVGISYEDYKKKKRKDWVLKRCGQSVLAVSMTYWTAETEQALIEKGAQGMKEYQGVCEAMIEDIVQ
jgi:dynein heavy chain